MNRILDILKNHGVSACATPWSGSTGRQNRLNKPANKGPAPLPDNRVELSWVVLSPIVELGLRLESWPFFYDWVVGSYMLRR